MALLVLDDIGFDKKIQDDQNIRKICMNGRHWGILFIICLQDCMGIRPNMRTNIDFVFCLKENIQSNIKKLYDHYFGIFDKLPEFKQVFHQLTEGYDCIVLDNTCKSNNLADCIFWYRATPNRIFRIGSKLLWNKHEELYNKEYNHPKTTEPINTPSGALIKSKKKDEIVVVKKGKKKHKDHKEEKERELSTTNVRKDNSSKVSLV